MIQCRRWRNAICASFVAGAFLHVAGAQAQVTLKLATQTIAGTAQYDGATQFAGLVEKKTNGRITIKVYGDGALGGDLQIVSVLQRGTIEMALMNAGLLNGVAKEFTIVDFPFLFNTEDEPTPSSTEPLARSFWTCFRRRESSDSHTRSSDFGTSITASTPWYASKTYVDSRSAPSSRRSTSIR